MHGDPKLVKERVIKEKQVVMITKETTTPFYPEKVVEECEALRKKHDQLVEKLDQVEAEFNITVEKKPKKFK
jgi:hypothetical protein